ncbi:hypothetical protein GZL_08844 [Streptomyces sp. 769]|nr:hypothetical protein GZL_08844 [Streptomyces sp. 769]
MRGRGRPAPDFVGTAAARTLVIPSWPSPSDEIPGGGLRTV